jgi:hypothetical protein
MNPLRDRIGWIVGAATLLAFQADAKTSLLIPDPLSLRMSSSGSSFLIASDAAAKNVAIVVRQLKGPDGKDLAPSEIALNPALIPEVTPAGVRVTVTAVSGGMTAPGDYTFTLYAEGSGEGSEKPALLKSGTLTNPKPEISAPSLKDTTIVLRRHWPGCGATGVRSVDLLLSGTLPLNQTTFGARIAGSADDVTAQPGEIDLRPADTPPPVGGIPPGLSHWTLNLSKFGNAGTFPATLLVHPQGGTAPVEIPFKIIVTDAAFLPLLAIAAGVLLALGVQIIANRLRPREENRLRMLELLMTVQNLRSETADPDRLKDLDELESRLRDAEGRNNDGNFAAVKTLLDQIEGDVSAARKAQRDDRLAAQNAFEQAQEALTAAQRAGGDVAKVAALQTRIDATAELIAGRRYLKAKALLTSIQNDITALGGQAAVAAAAVGLNIRMARGGTPPPPPAGAPVLTVKDDVAARTVDREISFVIIDSGNTLAAASKTVWNFDDGKIEDGKQPLRTTHRYASPATYAVTASVCRSDGTEIEKLSVPVTIAESAAGRVIKKSRWTVDSYDLLISAIAAVVAIVSGLWLLYAGKAFGSLAQYAEAFVWGFGIDNTVRGFAAVMKKVSG